MVFGQVTDLEALGTRVLGFKVFIRFEVGGSGFGETHIALLLKGQQSNTGTRSGSMFMALGFALRV